MESPPKKPWWQMTRTPAVGFWLGGLWLLFSVVRWWPLGSGGWVAGATAALFALLGASYIASSVAMLRRQRTVAAH